ncbi:MAG: hypothetical protein H7144_04645 [Burkholderiales bacterium]|nr:hypothetical protein [Phycisphaerae bacterium]
MQYFETLERRQLLAGVTIIAHGFNSGAAFGSWVDVTADEIIKRAGGDFAASEYTLTISDSLSTPITATLTRDLFSPIPTSTSSGEIVIKLDWSDLDGGISSAISTPTATVADVAADFILKSSLESFLLSSPIHLIGHSRGASLMTRIAEKFGQRGLWVDHFTSLDPHPVDRMRDPIDPISKQPYDFGDSPINVWRNVRFADNYWRTQGDLSLDFTGEPVATALNWQLDEGTLSGAGHVLEHSDVHLWYEGTINQVVPVNGRPSWYAYPNPSITAGYGYARQGDTGRPHNGLGTGSFFGGIEENRPFVNAIGTAWPNVGDVRLSPSVTTPVIIGETLNVMFNYQDYDSTADISWYLDTDRNPLTTASQIPLTSATLTATGTAMGHGTVQIPTSAVSASGTYYLLAQITDPLGQTRFDYAPLPIQLITASNLPRPTAELTFPVQSSRVSAAWINAAPKAIQITFNDPSGLDLTSITDVASEFTLSGSGVGTAQLVPAPPLLVKGSTYAYAFSGEFAAGDIVLSFPPMVFQNTAGILNISSTRTFSVASLPIADSQWSTKLVKDIRMGSKGSVGAVLGSNGSNAFLTADDGVHGFELWKSDGTASGTTLVKDITPGLAGSFVQLDLGGALSFVLNNVIYFSARYDTKHRELWRSDGTEAGTYLLRSFQGDYGAFSFCQVGNELFFRTNFYDTDYRLHSQLWKTNGTSLGTVLVKDFGQNSIKLKAAAGSKLIFVAHDEAHGSELWSSDGTNAGTLLLKDIDPGVSESGISDAVVLDGNAYFIAREFPHGYELWKTNGTSTGTKLVKDINVGAAHGVDRAKPLVVANGRIYFVGNSGTTGWELFSSDGTASGTILVRDISPGSETSNPTEITAVGNWVMYIANDSIHGEEIWKTDTATGQSSMLADIFPGITGGANGITASALGHLVFEANDGVRGSINWLTDGTIGGTSPTSQSINWYEGFGEVSGRLVVVGFDSEPYLYGAGVLSSPPAVIDGTLFNDANQNARLDVNEHPIANQQVFLDLNANNLLDAGESVVQTSANGGFTFSNLIAATYHVRAVLLSGQYISTPLVDIALSAGQTSDVRIGLYRATAGASISGIAYSDTNKNGKRDIGEGGLPSIKVWLDLDGDKVIDIGERSTTTDASGNYLFANVPIVGSGASTRVRAVIPGGATQILPANNYGYPVTLTTGYSNTAKDFGIYVPGIAPPPPPPTTTKGSISGFLFADSNKNGKFDAGEAYQAGKTVFIDLDGDNVLDSNEMKLTTDSKGVFKFSNLLIGTYKIRRVVPAGYKVTTPVRNIGVGAGQNVTGVTIGTASI